jgi:hypothetical protein
MGKHLKTFKRKPLTLFFNGQFKSVAYFIKCCKTRISVVRYIKVKKEVTISRNNKSWPPVFFETSYANFLTPFITLK